MPIDYIGQNPLHPDGGVESRGRSPGTACLSVWLKPVSFSHYVLFSICVCLKQVFLLPQYIVYCIHFGRRRDKELLSEVLHMARLGNLSSHLRACQPKPICNGCSAERTQPTPQEN
jgi:hypothetical protein